MQVHNAFGALDHARLAELLDDDYGGADAATDPVEYLEVMIAESVPDAAERAELLELLNAQREHLVRIPGAVENHAALFSAALRYAQRQPPAFQRAYLKNYLADCAQAYEGANAQSCTKGVWERLVFALGQAVSLDGAQDDAAAGVSPEQRAEYSALAAALFPEEQLTRPQLLERVRGLVSRCFNNEDMAARLEAVSGDDAHAQRRALVRECVLGRVREVTFAGVSAEDLDQAVDEELRAVDDVIVGGGGRLLGRRRRQTRKRSVTRLQLLPKNVGHTRRRRRQ
jgi:hypothetical protein